MIIFSGGKTFVVTRLDAAQWGISVVLGALSIPVGVVIRLIPDRLLPTRFWGLGKVQAMFATGLRPRAVDE